LDVHAALGDPARYRSQIDRLHRRHAYTRALWEVQQDGVSLASVCLHRGKVARLLAQTVARGEYRLDPARLRQMRVDGKPREVFAYRLTDLVVHGVVADIVTEAMYPRLSPSLYSYRRGVSWWQPIAAFAAYVRAHRRSRFDPRTRGLYVLRRDIHAYTDSIPVGDASPLWPMLRAVLGAPGARSPADWALIREVVRPEIALDGDARATLYRGVPTGQPISCALFNLYLADVDRYFDQVPGAFYARYCDDLLFAHPDSTVVQAAEAHISELLAALGLELNPTKSRTLYLTGAGRASVDWPEARGTTAVPFLGCAVSAAGTIALSRDKRRRLLADLGQRLRRTVRALGPSDPALAGRVLCRVVNRTLQTRIEFSQERSAVLLRRAVTDRRDLQQLDYLIARLVVRAVTGRPDVRGFRAVPYRRLRREWGLRSLADARNRGRCREAG
jgi:Reverse transcriptase (RNA-dependent DNA polymerase)